MLMTSGPNLMTLVASLSTEALRGPGPRPQSGIRGGRPFLFSVILSASFIFSRSGASSHFRSWALLM